MDTATESIIETLPVLKKKKTELTNKLEVLEERFTLREIGSDLYQKYSSKFENELRLIVREINESGKSTSNLNEKVKKCVKAIQNISETWGSGDFSKKQRVQKVVFPKGIYVNPKTREYRTYSINPVFAIASSLVGVQERQKKDASG